MAPELGMADRRSKLHDSESEASIPGALLACIELGMPILSAFRILNHVQGSEVPSRSVAVGQNRGFGRPNGAWNEAKPGPRTLGGLLN
jgi:hypothetical protein